MSYLFLLLSFIFSATSSEDLFVLVKGGTFTLGSGENALGKEVMADVQEGYGKGFEVTVADFYLMKTEVTVGMYKRYVEETGKKMPPAPNGHSEYFTDPKYDNYPMVNVNWYEAQAFCEHYGWRLPTEIEWEYAAKNGAKNWPYSFGQFWDPRKCSCYGAVRNDSPLFAKAFRMASAGIILPVASFNPNPLGIYDLTGSVWEWTSSDYWPYTNNMNYNYQYAHHEQPLEKTWAPKMKVTILRDRRGRKMEIVGMKAQKGILKVLKGGSFLWSDDTSIFPVERWRSAPISLRNEFRLAMPKKVRHFSFGFRCAKDAKTKN